MRRILSIIFLPLVFASCGGGGGGSLTLEGVTPSEATPGEIVTLAGNGLEEGDTVCFIPKMRDSEGDACHFPEVGEVPEDAEPGTALAVAVPGNALAGDYVVKVARADRFSEGVDFLVIARPVIQESPERIEDPAETPAPGTEVPAPGGPAVTEEIEPAEATEPTEAASPTPPPSVPVSVSLEGTEALHETRLGLVKIEWTCAGNPSECYLFGPFNRKFGDATCGLEDEERYLAVNPSGTDLNEGSANYNSYQSYATGDFCNAEGCHGFSLADMGGYFLPFCRITLQGTGGSFYTRMWQKNFKIRIVAKGEDGSVVSDEKVIEAPEPWVTVLDASISQTNPEILFDVEVGNAISVSATGASLVKGESGISLQNDGSGRKTYRFQLKKEKTEIQFKAIGIGGDSAQTKREVELGLPTVTLRNEGYDCDEDYEACVEGVAGDFPGKVELRWSVERPYTIREVGLINKVSPEVFRNHLGDFLPSGWKGGGKKDAVDQKEDGKEEEGVFSGVVPWVKKVVLMIYTIKNNSAVAEIEWCDVYRADHRGDEDEEGIESDQGCGNITNPVIEGPSDGKMGGTVWVPRDTRRFQWKARVVDFHHFADYACSDEDGDGEWADEEQDWCLHSDYDSEMREMPFEPSFEVTSSSNVEVEELACGIGSDIDASATINVSHVKTIDHITCYSPDVHVDSVYWYQGESQGYLVDLALFAANQFIGLSGGEVLDPYRNNTITIRGDFEAEFEDGEWSSNRVEINCGVYARDFYNQVVKIGEFEWPASEPPAGTSCTIHGSGPGLGDVVEGAGCAVTFGLAC